MATIYIMKEKPKRLTKTELRRKLIKQISGKKRARKNPAKVIDFYPDIHEGVEDILFDISKEPLIGNPLLDEE